MHSIILAVAQPQSQQAPSLTISVWWVFATGFFGAMGLATWKMLPWVIKKALDEKIDSKLLPMVTEVHTEMTGVHNRIDEHMDNEEHSFDTLNSTVTDVSNQLIARDTLFDGLQITMDKTREVLEQHMENDERQFALGAEALLAGQQQLIERIESMKVNTDKRAAEIRANTDENSRVIQTAVDTIVDVSNKSDTSVTTDGVGGEIT